MPLYVNQVATALHAKAATFRNAEGKIQARFESLQLSLDKLAGMSKTELEHRLEASIRPGARPTVEQDKMPFIIECGAQFNDHQDARRWAAGILQGVTTFAVDGSQIAPSRDISVPVGLVQIGWFANPHDAQQPYIKDICVEVLSGDDFERSEDSFTDAEIEWRRFKGEVDQILRFMKSHEGQAGIAFIDGSLIISFVGTLPLSRQQQYVRLMEELLTTSEETRVPVVGYVDTSYANDLVKLLDHLSSHESGTHIGDASLLGRRMTWGDRGRFYICSRSDGVTNNAFYEQVCFTYLKTTRDHPPARVELPQWVIEQDMQDTILDMVRADSIVGVGYPYTLETADAVAVLSAQDRERFYRLFQQFALEQTLPLWISRKAISKRLRRV